MEIAMVAIRPLLTKLGNLLAGQFTLEKRVKKSIESLVMELTLMHAALRKVAKVPPEQLDEGVKIWAGKVKELAYQMEDIIDVFMVRVENDDEPANLKSRVKKLFQKATRLFSKGKSLHRISDALEEAVGQAKQLAELRQRYVQEMCDTSTGASIDPRMRALYIDLIELVGIEDTRDELINLLIEDDDWLKHPSKTVSIVGFGGLGKTTLAKAVYDKIKVHFDCDAFVSVSQNPDMKKVFKDILYELDKKKYADIQPTRDVKQLIDELIEFLEDKRYLIIIDDIWDEKVWRLINCAFFKKSPGSRLITTTRIISVSEACCSSSDDIYRMKPLSDNVSKMLFYKRVFSHEKGCPHDLVKVSEDILKKCGGIPLAIITIASLLASNRQIKTEHQWYGVLNSIGRGLIEDDSVEEMKKILLFSYYDLPSYLKPCLLYLSIFPEDYTIMRDQLIWRWIAEGLVYTEKQETNLYELGESYFNELVNRCMIQPVDIDAQERIKACRVHDMVLDIIFYLSSEENFVTVLNGTEQLQSMARRLSIQVCMVGEATTINMPQLRSLNVFEHSQILLDPLISRSQILRLLDLDCAFHWDLGYVGNLLHLRYLRLSLWWSDCKRYKLPMEIGNLRCLQTLDIREAHIDELPSSIVWLRHLMCLYVTRETKLPSEMNNLTSLEVLDELPVGRIRISCPVNVWRGINDFNRDIAKELGHLTKLRVLRLVCRGLDGEDEGLDKALVESLKNLHKLQCLDISADTGRMDLMREGWVPPAQLRRLKFDGQTGSFLTLPAWVNPSSLPLLSYLEICLDDVRAEDVQLLGMLPALRYLYVEWNTGLFEGRSVEISAVASDAFPCATECHFLGIAALPSIFPRGAMPMVTRLGFGFPASWITRGGIDLGMAGHLPSLQTLEVGLLCKGASSREVNEAKAALTAAADGHRNHPTIKFEKW